MSDCAAPPPAFPIVWLQCLARLLLLAALGLAGLPDPATAQGVRLAGSHQDVIINLRGGLPVRWLACAGPCAADGPRELLLRAGEGGNQIAWDVPGDPAAAATLANLGYDYDLYPSDRGVAVILTSRGTVDGIPLIHRYRTAPDGHLLEASLQVPAGARLRLAAGSDLVPPPLPGPGSLHARVRAVAVAAAGQAVLSPAAGAMPMAVGDWAGIRGRFWTLVLGGNAPMDAVPAPTGELPQVLLGPAGGAAGPVELRFYAGPLELAALTAASPVLAGQLYPGMPSPLRWIAFRLAELLGALQILAGDEGIAVLLFAATATATVTATGTVALALLPLAFRRRADERTDHPGHRLRRLGGVLAGALLAIGVGLPALAVLGEDFRLAGARFLWIDDLSLPDRVLPFAAPAPFFGDHLNLLPAIVAALLLLAARQQTQAGQAVAAPFRRRDWLLAGLAFCLTYGLPAASSLGLVTGVSVFLLLGAVRRRWLRPEPHSVPSAASGQAAVPPGTDPATLAARGPE